jgi:pimeloyl-ACP methyl ester carboxylesterase
MIRARIAGAAAVVCAACLMVWPAAGAADAGGVAELPVSFTVTNSNTSQAPCFSDGATYVVRGHITGPQSILSSGRAGTITVYLYGYEGGEWNWHFKGVPGYDYATEMAKLGHVSLTIDELGYGASGIPRDGNLTCQGAEADVTHQIVQQLRSGHYSAGARRGIGFSKVVLAGHDVGGQVAEIEAYSYSDVDGLIVMTWADQGFTQYILQRSIVAANDWCTVSPAETQPGSPTSYVHFVSQEEWRTLLFYDADPRVIDATDAVRLPNPCGIVRSGPTAVEFDLAHDSQIKVPVLVAFGDNDTLVWSRQGEEQQQSNYGSTDKSTVFVPYGGHFLMFGRRSGPLLRSAVSSWLDSRFRGG